MKHLIRKKLELIAPKIFNVIRIWRFKKWVLPDVFLKHLKRLNSDSLAIDIGANIGIISECIATTGANVISFEPNKEAFKKLECVSRTYQNIRAHPVAAGIKNDIVKLYLHKDSIKNTNKNLSVSSSLKAEKPNVSSEYFEEINEIDFAECLVNLDRYVDLIKIDIEGYEIELINHILDRGMLNNIGMIYLETHERKFPALKDATQRLKLRIKKEGYEKKFYFDWR